LARDATARSAIERKQVSAFWVDVFSQAILSSQGKEPTAKD